MANEIQVAASIAVTKGGVTISANSSRVATMAGNNLMTSVQNVGTASEALVLGDISTIGYIFLRNMDATNYVEIALDNGNTQKICKLLPGDIALFPASTATIYGKADTAACDLHIACTEI